MRELKEKCAQDAYRRFMNLGEYGQRDSFCALYKGKLANEKEKTRQRRE